VRRSLLCPVLLTLTTATATDWQQICAHEKNPSPLDFDSFCTAEKGCWPASWLIGVQKAATTSTVDALHTCGVVSLAYTETDNFLPCPAKVSCKETHAFNAPPVNPNMVEFQTVELGNAAAYTRLFDPRGCDDRDVDATWVADVPWSVSTATCAAGRFLEGTNEAQDESFPRRLASLMPPNIRTVARFAIILREPIERELSIYNHLKELGMGGLTPNTTFAEHVDSLGLQSGTFGLGALHQPYSWFLNQLDEAGFARSQILVISYHVLTANASSMRDTVRRLTTHYGTPVLANVTELPASNTLDNPFKTITIQCTTRDALEELYAPYNRELYSSLHDAHERNVAPTIETPFEPFQIKVPCGAYEEQKGDAVNAQATPSRLRRIAHSRPSRQPSAAILPEASEPVAA